MYKLQATLKVPTNAAPEILAEIKALGVPEPTAVEVPYEVFIDESRLYWDYVHETMKTERKPVTYIKFDFEDSEAGRKAAYDVEFGLHQIPINLRYVEI